MLSKCVSANNVASVAQPVFRQLINAAFAIRVKIEMTTTVSFNLNFIHVAMTINSNNCEKEVMEN